MSKPVQKSDASQIQTLVGCEAIRKRPSMYVGGIGSPAVMRLILEGVGNVLDLYNEHAADELFVSVNQKTNEIVISDNGYGMPLEKIKDIMTVPHTSGKFADNGFSIGMNGVN